MSKIEEDPRGHGGAGAGVGIGIGASTPEHKETVRAACLRSLLRLWLPGCVCCLVRAQSQCVCWWFQVILRSKVVVVGTRRSL